MDPTYHTLKHEEPRDPSHPRTRHRCLGGDQRVDVERGQRGLSRAIRPARRAVRARTSHGRGLRPGPS